MNNLVELLRWRSFNQADHTAYTFLPGVEAAGTSLSYAALDRRVRALATHLQNQNAAGERVLLLYPPGLDYIIAYFACLYAGAIAVPAYPPKHNRHFARLQAIASDAHAQLALTLQSTFGQAAAVLDSEPGLVKVHLIASDCIPEDQADQWMEVKIKSDALAHLQYTSGSTARPKGVMVTHGNLMHNSEYISQGFDHSPGSVSLTWLPHFHDMGLLDGIIQPLYKGFPALLMSPGTFLQQPCSWLRTISRFRVTHSGGPNFAYDLCARTVSDEQLATLDLSSWRVAYNGAEPIRSESLERFADRFGLRGFQRSAFYPAYGLAEATLKVTGGSSSDEPVIFVAQREFLKKNQAIPLADDDSQAVTLVGVGRVSSEVTVRIVDPESLTECLPCCVGEIWVAGPSVACGYWNRPEETEEIFQARFADTGEGPFLRTGDLGFLDGGELYVTGRLKDLIIIRGQNHYPQDIELTVDQSNPFVRAGCGAAFPVEVAGEERLVVVQELGRRQPPDPAAVIADIRRAIGEQHELQVYAVMLVKLGSVPKTSSGKIQRHACRIAFLAGQLEVIASDILAQDTAETAFITLNRAMVLALEPNERLAALESYLLVTSAQVLKVAQIDRNRPLTSYGLDSLTAVELKNRIDSDLTVDLPAGTLLDGRNVSLLAEDILGQLPVQPKDARNALALPAEDEYPLSATQQALWFLQQMVPESTAYNVAVAVRTSTLLEVGAVRKALEILIQRHDSLRTTFVLRNEQPVQRINTEPVLLLDEVDATECDTAELRRRKVDAAHRPFDLVSGPVVRAYLFNTNTGESIFMLNAHHLIVDGWSCGLLLKEFRKLYAAQVRGESISPASTRTRYADFVRWQEQFLSSDEGERMWSYWQHELGGELPVLKLFSGRQQSATQTFAGESHHFQLSSDVTAGLRLLAQAEGTTLYTLLLAAFQVLLQRYTAQDDILIGSPVAARTPAQFENVVGCFFNAIVLRADLSGDPAFNKFLRMMRSKVLGALDHQHYPSHVLNQRLRHTGDHGNRQLFQVSFIMQKLSRWETDSQPGAHTDAEWTVLPLERKGARAELELELIESDSSIDGLLQYSTELCDAAAAAGMARHYANLLQSILTEPGKRISRLSILDDTERRSIARIVSERG